MDLRLTDDVDAREAHICETCFKAYQRRDLLMRHRRRCQKPKNSLTRRKACDVCVQAKAKCDYKQPTCSRCAKRDTPCHYVNSGNSTDSNENNLNDTSSRASLETSRTQAADVDYSSLSTAIPAGTLGEPFEVAPSWSLQVPSWPLLFDEIDTTMQGPEYDRIFGIADPDNSAPVSASRRSTSSPWSTRPHNADSLIAHSTTTSGLTSQTSVASLGELDIDSAPLNYPNVAPCKPWTFVRVLTQYPSLLLSDDFSSPFIHRVMYNEQVSDMTTLPRTSMAICCGSGIHSSDSARYIKRAIDAERQRLIEEFPTYQCMEQWDVLHAMLLYEILELREAYRGLSDSSRQKTRVKGLQLPFILKVRGQSRIFVSQDPFLAHLLVASQMTQCYSKSYPEILNPDMLVFLDNGAGMKSPGKSPWNKWMITETARRTIFLTYIVNFLCNRDFESGKQSPYYEPLDDDLIMNMPLPCSHTLWSARTEDEWTRLVMQQHEPSALASDSVFGFNPPLPESSSPQSSQPTIKSILSKVTKDYLRKDSCNSVGFADSDELKRFCVLCVLEQVD